jgi:phosphopantothenoylcysteine decarboxylase/phosphopantothenate--cysteine ligase
VRVVPPRDAYGKHNLPDEGELTAEVCRAVSRSKLKGRRILVTGGETPVPIDGGRRIVDRNGCSLGIAIAAELHLRGAETLLIQGGSAFPVPSFVPHRVARTYDDYRAMVSDELERGYEAGVFSAGVADYRPATVTEGKIPSGQEKLQLTLVPTVKIIEEVRQAHPGLYMITFKYQEGLPHEELMARARARLDRFPCVVANRGDEQREQQGWLLTRDAAPVPLDGQRAIAEAIGDHLERGR